MEVKVEEIKALEPIKFNYKQIKQELMTKIENYKNIVYTEDTLKEAKTDRANFNKLAKALNDEKLRIKNTVLEPYTTFEKQMNELVDLVKKASNNADTQIKEFEQHTKNEKLQKIVDFFTQNVGKYEKLIDFDTIFNERWLNVTYKIEQVEQDILHIFKKTSDDLEVLDGQIKDEIINKQAKAFYFKNIANASVLSESLKIALQISENNKKLEELSKKEEKATENVQNVTKNEESITKSDESSQKNANLKQIDFRIWATNEQLIGLKEFLIANKIKYGKVD